jgi:hypothetical protein
LGAYAYLCRSTEIDVTPGTAKSNAGRSVPSRRRYGSVQPPKHASTWQRTPAAAATAAISPTGSTTPWAYDGAEHATSTVSSRTAAATASGAGASVSGDTGTRSNATPR